MTFLVFHQTRWRQGSLTVYKEKLYSIHAAFPITTKLLSHNSFRWNTTIEWLYFGYLINYEFVSFCNPSSSSLTVFPRL